LLIDSMLPPQVVELLCAMGHEAVAPSDIGAHNLPDEVLIQIASAERWVIVTENALDFVHVTTCPVLLVRKRWWPASGLAQRLAVAVGGWADRNPEPGDWPHWLPTNLR
jgi:hypothetical protein